MNSLLRKLTTVVVTLPGVFLAPVAFAGAPATLLYGPVPLGVPTLDGIALAVLAMLLTVIALRVMWTQHKGVNMVIALAAFTALVSGVGGLNLASDAWAPPSGMTDPTGGEVPLSVGPNNVPNMTGVPQEVLDVVIANSESCSIGAGGNGGNGGNGGGGDEPRCAQRPIVPPGESCTVFIDCEFE